MKKSPRIALVHDYLNEFGGAERVLLAISELYPSAPIYTIYAKKNSPAWEHFRGRTIKQSWFSYLPFADRLISPFRFLVPLIWPQFNFEDYDLVITSASWAVTKGMRGAKRELCYLHTPPRYLYGYDTSRNWQGKWFSGLIKAYALIVNHFMRVYDFKQAQKPDTIIVNSQNIGRRVQKFYRRQDYLVLYPPVDIEKFKPGAIKPESKTYYLTGGRLIASKNFDLIIKAFNKNGLPLKVFGTGLDEPNLKRLAARNIQFMGKVSEQDLIDLYQNAHAFIVAARDEDFGITPIEAAAAGCPTIAYRSGGYLESVIESKTGLFFDELTPESLNQAIKKFKSKRFTKHTLASHARKFGKASFQKQFQSVINNHA